MSSTTSTDSESFIQLRYLPWIAAAYAAGVFIYRVVLYPRFFSVLRNVPGPPLGNSLFGHYFSLAKNESCIPLREWTKVYGPVVRMMGPLGLETLIFLSPAALDQIMVRDWLEHPRPNFARHVLGFVAGYGLLTTTGDAHKQLRRATSPAFSIPNLMAQTELYYRPIEGLIEILGGQIKAGRESETANGKVVAMYGWISKLTLDIICEAAFGYKVDCLHDPSNELAVAVEQGDGFHSGENLAWLGAIMALPFAARVVSSDWLFRHRAVFGPAGKFLDIKYRLRTFSAGILRTKAGDSSSKNILRFLLRAAREADLPEEARRDAAAVEQVLTVLSAGHETVGTGLAWTIWLLSTHPDVQRRLREEVSPVYAANPRPDYRTLQSLVWLDCVVNESLRLFPPIPATLRVAGKTDYIDGVLVPKGTLLAIPHVLGEDAEEFRPARWLNLPAAYDPTFSMFSFLAGPHACIGKTMALSEIKAVLVALIANFEFAPAYEGQIAQPAASIALSLF
ncbi:cytochrome P450 [Mycena galericulata]|nr:cytochrome P450 [Mycena galericulata]